MNYNIYYENRLVITLNSIKDVIEYCNINQLKVVYELVYEFVDVYEEYTDIFTEDEDNE